MNFEDLRKTLRALGCVVGEWEGVTTVFYKDSRLLDIVGGSIAYYWPFFALPPEKQVEIEDACDKYQRGGK